MATTQPKNTLYVGKIELDPDNIAWLSNPGPDKLELCKAQVSEFVQVAQGYFETRDQLPSELRAAPLAVSLDALEKVIRAVLAISFREQQKYGTLPPQGIPVARLAPFVLPLPIRIELLEQAVEMRSQGKTLGAIGAALSEAGPEAVDAYQQFLHHIEAQPIDYPFGFVYSTVSDALVPVCASLCRLGLCEHPTCQCS